MSASIDRLEARSPALAPVERDFGLTFPVDAAPLTLTFPVRPGSVSVIYPVSVSPNPR